MPGFNEKFAETAFQPNQHNADYLRKELQSFQRKEKPIGWNISGAEIKFLKAEELKDSDLALFDQVENEEINAGNVMTLEKAIKDNFSGLDREKEKSRFHFEAFLRSLLFNKWCVFVDEQKRKAIH